MVNTERQLKVFQKINSDESVVFFIV